MGPSSIPWPTDVLNLLASTSVEQYGRHKMLTLVMDDTQLLLHSFLDSMCYSQKPWVKLRNGAAQLISNALHVSLTILRLVMTHNYVGAEMHCCTLSCFMNMRRRMATS